LLLRIQELEEKLLETQLQLERVTDEKLTHMLSIQKSPTNKTGMYLLPLILPLLPGLSLSSLQSQSLPPLLKIKGRTKLMEMFRALRSLIPKENLLYAIITV
jgi:hypothetical protein